MRANVFRFTLRTDIPNAIGMSRFVPNTNVWIPATRDERDARMR
jgi:hypothetical protein